MSYGLKKWVKAFLQLIFDAVFNNEKQTMNEIFYKKWNDRYCEKEYAFGEEPNVYLKEQLEKLDAGKILFPAEGEGRNATFAGKLGWNVSAFDISAEGKKKALQLAKKNKVTMNYQLGELPDLAYSEDHFDVVSLIYAHFPPAIKSNYHQLLDKLLRKDGLIIFEAFSKNNLGYRKENPKIGGPVDIDFLFSIEEIESDFSNYEIIELEEKEVKLNEGLYHIGLGSVIRFVGRKK